MPGGGEAWTTIGPTAAAKLLLHLNLGVTIFFLISGFLLYRPFIAHRGGGPEAPALVDYARRRALRIIPAYWLILSVLVLVPGLTGVSGGEWLQQYALLQAIPLSGTPSCVTHILDCGVAHTWSLAVEMTFYASLPLFVIAAAGARPAEALGVGAAGARPARGAVLAVHRAFGAIALLLMLPAVFADDEGGLPRRLLALPAVAWLGLISYGIFLWHYVVALELGSAGEGLGFWPLLAATLAITIPVAAASYYGLERPLLRLKYRRGRSGRPGSAPTGGRAARTPS